MLEEDVMERFLEHTVYSLYMIYGLVDFGTPLSVNMPVGQWLVWSGYLTDHVFYQLTLTGQVFCQHPNVHGYDDGHFPIMCQQ